MDRPAEPQRLTQFDERSSGGAALQTCYNRDDSMGPMSRWRAAHLRDRSPSGAAGDYAQAEAGAGTTGTLYWPKGSAEFTLDGTDLHVWAFRLDQPTASLPGLADVLSSEERDRAAGFHFQRHRNQFIAARGLLRIILSRYLRRAPQRLQFGYGKYGKPELRTAPNAGAVQFNLAHSETLALLAITQTAPVGVDVERIRLVEDMDELVVRFFSARENAKFQELSSDQKSEAFFNLWTRKEAWLKATGKGIGQDLHRVEVSFLPGEAARLVRVPKRLEALGQWSLHDLHPAPDFIAAVAVPPECSRLSCWSWDGVS
jgi:4'-phosphopantetheinyl transferase